MDHNAKRSKQDWISIIQENNNQQIKLQILDCDLSGVNLENCYLENAELTRVNLSGAILGKINLQHSKLTDVTFENAQLTGALFTNSEISECSFKNTKIVGARFSGSKVENSSYHNITGTNSQFNSCVFINTDVSDSIFINSDFSRSKFTDINLNNTQIQGSDFDNAQIDTKLLVGKNLSKCKLAFLNFEGSDLRNTNLNDAYLFHAYMKGVNMSNHELDGVNLSYADLENANLKGLKINEGELEYTNLNGADLSNAHFLNSRSVNGISFENACLDGFVLSEFDWESFYSENRETGKNPLSTEEIPKDKNEICYNFNIREIPTFEPEVHYDEALEEAIFLCPYSNTNVFKWEDEGFPDVEELVIYSNNLSDTFEDTHVNKTLISLKQELMENELINGKHNLESYILKQLTPDLPYYRLILQHPDGENSDFVTVIYQGEFYK